MMAALRGAVVGACSLLLCACSVAAEGPVAIQTYPTAVTVCELLPMRGLLIADPTWGLALMGTDEEGKPHEYGVVWPHGYSARREQGVVLLLDASGMVDAQEGDSVVLDAARKDVLYPCADIVVVQTRGAAAVVGFRSSL